jgi:hypothetical protein
MPRDYKHDNRRRLYLTLLSLSPQMRVSSILTTLLVSLPLAFAQIPCDDEYGKYCPESSPDEVGDCLAKHDLSPGCDVYVKVMAACKADLQQRW